MNFPPVQKQRSRQRGSILVICLVLAGVGTIGAAAFFSLIQAKSIESEEQLTAIKRRTILANSRILASEAISRRFLDAGSALDAEVTYALPDGWGSATVKPFSDLPGGFSTSHRTHQSGATPLESFSLDIDVAIDDGNTSPLYQFQLKSRSPLLGGDLLYLSQPTLNAGASNRVTGALHIKGRARLWTGGGKHQVNIRAREYLGPNPTSARLVLSDLAGNSHLPQNFPFVPMTSGGFNGGDPSFSGQGSVIVNADNGGWNQMVSNLSIAGASADDGSYYQLDGSVPFPAPSSPPLQEDPVVSDGNGILTIRSALLDQNVHIVNNVETVIFKGSPTETESDIDSTRVPVIIVIENPTGSSRELKTIQFEGWNKRRILLGVRNPRSNTTVDLLFTGASFPTWRLLCHFENVDLRVDLSDVSAATLVGGIWTDRGINIESGTLTVERETDPGEFAIIAPRLAWVERIRQTLPSPTP